MRFKNRLYLEFNVQFKKIKLRDTVTKIMGSPDVYLRAKVPEDIYDTLQKFAEMRKLERMSLVRDFNLFPEPERLLNLERKYGDSLSHEDLYGVPQKPKKKRMEEAHVGFGEEMPSSTTALSQQPSGMGNTTMSAMERSKRMQAEEQENKKEKVVWKGETITHNDMFEETLKNRTEKDTHQQNLERLKAMSTGRPPKERMNIPEGVEVFMYGN